MTVVVAPSRARLAQTIAESKNVGDTQTTQQSQGITTATQALVVGMGIPINNTPAGTPGPSGSRYGMQFFDDTGTLRVQIDAYGWHQYDSSGAYVSEIVTY